VNPVSEWLDRKESEGVDVSGIALPDELAFDSAPDETVFFQTYNPCSILCDRNHPFSTVERYGHWYHARGQDRKAGIHRPGMEWSLFTRSRGRAIQTAKSHME